MDASTHNLAVAVQRVGLPAVVAPAQGLPAKAAAEQEESMLPEAAAQSIPEVAVADQLVLKIYSQMVSQVAQAARA
jgi:hypothetical protein